MTNNYKENYYSLQHINPFLSFSYNSLLFSNKILSSL